MSEPRFIVADEYGVHQIKVEGCPRYPGYTYTGDKAHPERRFEVKPWGGTVSFALVGPRGGESGAFMMSRQTARSLGEHLLAAASEAETTGHYDFEHEEDIVLGEIEVS